MKKYIVLVVMLLSLVLNIAAAEKSLLDFYQQENLSKEEYKDFSEALQRSYETKNYTVEVGQKYGTYRHPQSPIAVGTRLFFTKLREENNFDVGMLNFLLDRGVDVNTIDGFASTPGSNFLYYSILHDNGDAITLLENKDLSLYEESIRPSIIQLVHQKGYDGVESAIEFLKVVNVKPAKR